MKDHSSLDAQTLCRLREHIELFGLTETAKRVGVARATLAAIVGQLPTHPGSRAQVIAALSRAPAFEALSHTPGAR